MNNTEDSIGDNKEFGVAAISEITLFFNGGATQDKTSADDTDLIKYTDNHLAAKKISIRSDQTIQVVSMNGVALTSPITIILNKGHTERYETPLVFKMVLKTLTANTNIKVRVI